MLADIPAASLDADAPLYDRPRREPRRPRPSRQRRSARRRRPADVGADLLDLLVDPSWVFRQYDHQLFLNTVEGPGGDATVLRLKHPTTGVDTGRGLALTSDGNHRWCALDPRRGTALVVAEAVMNLACVGARPLGLVNCLNFGNPEHPEVMWQLRRRSTAWARRAGRFGIPVVGGNVSLYNESRGRDIDPTPVVGLRRRWSTASTGAPRASASSTAARSSPLGPDAALAVRLALGVGARATEAAPPPDLDLDAHAAVADLVRDLVAEGLLAGRARHRRRRRASRWPRWPCAAGMGFRRRGPRAPITRGCSPSRASRVVACVLERPPRRRRAGRAVGRRRAVTARARPAATASSSTGLLDVRVDDAVDGLATTACPRPLGAGDGPTDGCEPSRWRSAAARLAD